MPANSTPPPATGVAALFQVLNTVLGIFPRWLIVTAAAVVLTFFAWDFYNRAIRMPSENVQAAAQARSAKAQADAMTYQPIIGAGLGSSGNLNDLKALDGGPCNPDLPLVKRGTAAANAVLPSANNKVVQPSRASVACVEAN